MTFIGNLILILLSSLILGQISTKLNMPAVIGELVYGIISKFWADKYSSLLLGFSKNEGNIVGAGMISRGEVALIVAQLGQSQHLFSQDIYSSLIFVIIISTILSPFILNHFIKIQAAPNK